MILIGEDSSAGTLLPSPTTPASGTVRLGDQSIAFSGLDSIHIDRFAAVTLITPNGPDALEIASPSAGLTRISGTSGPLSLIPLILSNTAMLTLDAATNDADGAADDAFGISATPATKLQIQAGTGVSALTLAAGHHVLGDTLTVAGDHLAFTVRGSAALDLPGAVTLAALTIREAGQVKLSDSPTSVLATAGLSIADQGRLDLSQGHLIAHANPTSRLAVFDQITNWIKASYSSQPNRWEGPGITSSQAQANRLRGLAVALNDRGDGQTPLVSDFAGLPADVNSILVRFSWNGDVTLDGKVDIADYFLVDSGFITQQGSYRNGDLNFDGQVDIADYFLIDSAFIGQANPLATPTLAASLPRTPWPFLVTTPATPQTLSILTEKTDKPGNLEKPLLSVLHADDNAVLRALNHSSPVC